VANSPLDQNLFFDTELSLAGASLTGTPVLVGTLANEPVILMIKNQTNQIVFIADNPGTTKGTTMAADEEIIFDCRANAANAVNMGFPIGTSFFATGPAGTGNIKISSIYAS
jgi:hypothetical protein